MLSFVFVIVYYSNVAQFKNFQRQVASHSLAAVACTPTVQHSQGMDESFECPQDELEFLLCLNEEIVALVWTDVAKFRCVKFDTCSKPSVVPAAEGFSIRCIASLLSLQPLQQINAEIVPASPFPAPFQLSLLLCADEGRK